MLMTRNFRSHQKCSIYFLDGSALATNKNLVSKKLASNRVMSKMLAKMLLAVVAFGMMGSFGGGLILAQQPPAPPVPPAPPTEGSSGIVVMSARSTAVDGGDAVFESVEVLDSGGNQFMFPMQRPAVDTTSWRSLLTLPDVREELEIVDGQYQDILAASKDMEREMKSMVEGMMKDGFDPTKAKNLAEVMREQRDLAEEKLQNLLLPSQLARLRQLALHVRMKQNGAENLLGSPEVIAALEMDSAQVEALKQKAADLKQKLEEKYAALKKKAEQELLDELKPSQREKLEEIMGNEFDFEMPTADKRGLKKEKKSSIKD